MALQTYEQKASASDSVTAGAFAFDLVSGTDYAISKMAFGALGTVTYVTSSAGLPVAQQGTWTVDLGATDNAVLDAIAASVAASATAAAQTTGNGLLTTIDADTGTMATLLGTIDTDTGAIATSIASVDTKTPALGQALAAASVPVVLTAAQLTTLTPPAAITGFATAANQTTGNSSLATLAGAVSGTEVQVDVLTMPTVAVTGTFWQATQPVSLTSTTITGTVAATQSGTWQTEVASGYTFTHNVTPSIKGGWGTFFFGSATAPGNVTDGNAVTGWALQNGSQVVNLAVGGTLVTGSAGLPVAQQGTWTVGLSAAQTLATVTTVTTVSTLTGGGVAHDGVDSGNPIKIGARASATLSDDTMVANADRTDAVSDLDGAIIIREGFPLSDLITERVTNTDGTSTAFTNFGATASTRNYVTAISVYNSSATAGTIDFRDGTSGAVLWTIPIPATGGAVISGGGSPLFYTTANTALAFDVSGALTTVTISITGFKSKARA